MADILSPNELERVAKDAAQQNASRHYRGEHIGFAETLFELAYYRKKYAELYVAWWNGPQTHVTPAGGTYTPTPIAPAQGSEVVEVLPEPEESCPPPTPLEATLRASVADVQRRAGTDTAMQFGAEAAVSLRDWFAGLALAGLCANPEWNNALWQRTAEDAYAAADAMLDARAK